METIKIEYGTDEKGQPQYLEVPKTLKDDAGNVVDFQDILNKVNGKVKSVTNAEFTKKYGAKLQELEQLQQKVASMKNPSEEMMLLQQEIENLKLEQLPEKERALAKLTGELQKAVKRAEAAEVGRDEVLNKYRTKSIITEIQNSLPEGILPTAREDLVRLLKDYAQMDDKENIVFQNIFEEGGEPLNAKDFNEKYFAQPTKAHFIASNLIPGTGTTGGGARDAAGKQRFSGKAWQEKIATAKSEEREQLNRAYAKGEIVITD